jgi:hypothetical protein
MTASSVSLTPCDHLLEVSLVLGRVGARGELALDGGLAQQVGVGDHALHCGLDRLHPFRQLADFVLAVDVELEAEVAGRPSCRWRRRACRSGR